MKYMKESKCPLTARHLPLVSTNALRHASFFHPMNASLDTPMPRCPECHSYAVMCKTIRESVRSSLMFLNSWPALRIWLSPWPTWTRKAGWCSSFGRAPRRASRTPPIHSFSTKRTRFAARMGCSGLQCSRVRLHLIASLCC